MKTLASRTQSRDWRKRDTYKHRRTSSKDEIVTASVLVTGGHYCAEDMHSREKARDAESLIYLASLFGAGVAELVICQTAKYPNVRSSASWSPTLTGSASEHVR